MSGEAPVARQSLSPEGHILEVNPAWELLSGYSATEMVGRNYLDLVPEDHVADFLGNLEKLMEDGELIGQDCFLRRKDGAVRSILIFARIDSGAERTNCVLIDITDFRNVESELVASEQRYRSLFDLSPTPIVIHDGLRIMMANQACARFLGYDSPDDLLGTPVVDIVSPEHQSLVAERVRRLMSEDWVAPSQEECFVRKDGTLAYGEVVASSATLGGQRVVHVSALDLTERLSAKAALEESESRFRDLFEFSGDSIVVHDGTTAMFANRAALERFGLPLDTDTSGLLLEDFMHPDSLQIAHDRIVALMSGQESEAPAELRLKRADGDDWYAEAKSTAMRIDGRRVLQTTFRDLTERKRSEFELELYRAQLELLLAERTESLERLRQQLGAVIAVVSRTIETRDPYTAGHQRRVTVLAVAVARQLGMDELDIEHLEFAARLHDVGKVGVPVELLSKPSSLSRAEFELVKTHVDAGYEIVLSAGFEGDVAEIMRQHHERLDGSGYPRGLQAQDILPSAKVLMVSDVVEAMSSHRPYRPSLGHAAAIEEIQRNRGSLYDEITVDACVAVLEGGFDFGEPSL